MSEYYNPQQEPGSERRLLLVFALTFIVLMVFQPLLTKYLRPGGTAAPETAKSADARGAIPSNGPLPPAASVASAGGASAAAVSGASTGENSVAAVQASAEAETVIENDLYRITFTNRGGQVKSWVLKKYQDERRQPLNLVHPKAVEQNGYPLSLWSYDESLRKKLNSVLYVSSAAGEQKAPAGITFEYRDAQVHVVKTFQFDDSYVVTVKTRVESNGQRVTAYPAWPSGFGDQGSAASYAAGRVEWQQGDKVERQEAKKISGGNTVPGPFQWIGVADQYFAAAFMPENPSTASAVTLRSAIEVPKDAGKADSQKIRVEILGIAAGDTNGGTSSRLFVGPKSLNILESVPTAQAAGQSQPADLRGLVNFGFFSLIARPLFLWLRWTHDHIVGNWGWAIVCLTFIINLVLFPLRFSSMKSAMKMQKLQPQMNAIKDKYKKYAARDPRKAEMNQEIAALFKREGANPAGGCLPLVIQMPFLFAFYAMLGSAIELRHANWLWIRDLSSPDPLYIIPVFIVASTFAMQRMTPQAGMDPAQQKMMTVMMPVMLGFISWSLSAGLGVYWILGNVIGVVQQVVLNRTNFGQEMRELAEKRARQKAAK